MQNSRNAALAAGLSHYFDECWWLNFASIVLFALFCLVPSIAQQPANTITDSSAGPPPSAPASPQTPDNSGTQSNGTQNPAQPAALSNSEQRKKICARPADPNFRTFGCRDQDVDWEDTLSYDLDNGVIREKLHERGFTPTISYYLATQTNATGGTHAIWAYAGMFSAAVNLDFDKLLKIPGMSFYLDGRWGTGSNLSTDLGAVFPVNTVYALGAWFGEMYLQQKFLRGDLTIVLGRFGANGTFATLPVLSNYVSLGLFPTPMSMIANDYAYGGPPPGNQWAAQALYDISPEVQLAAGVFNNNLNSSHDANIFAFQQGNKGALVAAQITYFHHQRITDTRKYGQYTAGFFEDNNAFTTLANAAVKSQGNAGLFVLGQQMVYRPHGPGTPQGLMIWGAYTYTSRQVIDSMPIYGGAGLSYQGLFHSRSRDITSVGWAYGLTSKYIQNASYSNMLEVNYQWFPKRYLTIIPDFQYLLNPKGTISSNAAVFGVQVNLVF